MWPALWGSPCRATASSGTPSTQRHAWSPRACVSAPSPNVPSMCAWWHVRCPQVSCTCVPMCPPHPCLYASSTRVLHTCPPNAHPTMHSLCRHMSSTCPLVSSKCMSLCILCLHMSPCVLHVPLHIIHVSHQVSSTCPCVSSRHFPMCPPRVPICPPPVRVLVSPTCLCPHGFHHTSCHASPRPCVPWTWWHGTTEGHGRMG